MPAANPRGLRIRQVSLLAGAVFTATCGSGSTDTGGAKDTPPTVVPVSMTITPNPLVVRQGVSIQATLTFSRSAASSTTPLALSATGLSDGTTVTFNPATITTS